MKLGSADAVCDSVPAKGGSHGPMSRVAGECDLPVEHRSKVFSLSC